MSYENGRYHGRTARDPLPPASAGAELTAAMRGEMSATPAFGWAFAQTDYFAGYEAGLIERFWGQNQPTDETRAELAKLRAALPWKVAK